MHLLVAKDGIIKTLQISQNQMLRWLQLQTVITSLWSLGPLHLHACQVRVTVGDSGLCCTCVTYFEHQLTPLCVDSFPTGTGQVLKTKLNNNNKE